MYNVHTYVYYTYMYYDNIISERLYFVDHASEFVNNTNRKISLQHVEMLSCKQILCVSATYFFQWSDVTLKNGF